MKSAAGSMDRRVAILRRILTKDATGIAVETYDLRAEVWAMVQELSGRQFVAARQQDIEATIKVRMRFRFDLGDTDRLVYKTRVYEIVHQAEFGRSDDLELLCNEVDVGKDQAAYDAINLLGLGAVSAFEPVLDNLINGQLSQGI
ncbi:MAG TPA: hypothetical protein DCF63_05690 [Planctomycetaceae bacterium]|nr:hypothetical protein [Planctomycetaceae bacterium]